MSNEPDPNNPLESKLGKLRVEMFPDEILLLQQELIHHPDLQVILALQADPDFYVRLADIAAYCGVIVDGNYTYEDILGMIKVCTVKLYNMRKITIVQGL
jgi:hypothetical protein